MNLTNAQKQYVLREAFNGGIPLFVRHIYNSVEQLENAVLSTRRLLYDLEKSPSEYYFWFVKNGRGDIKSSKSNANSRSHPLPYFEHSRNSVNGSEKSPVKTQEEFRCLQKPGATNQPFETLYFTNLSHILAVERQETGNSSEKIWSEKIKDEDLFNKIKSNTITSTRALLNQRLFANHPDCLITYNEWSQNIYNPWQIKFPLPQGQFLTSSVSDEQIYGQIKAGLGDSIGEFLGLLDQEISQEDKNKLNKDGLSLG
jgi:hypothetical protein